MCRMGKWESMTFPRYADEGCEVETDEQTLQLSQLPATVTAAQGQLGLRQGRGLHLGHQHLFPREHVRFQEKLKRHNFFVTFVREAVIYVLADFAR